MNLRDIKIVIDCGEVMNEKQRCPTKTKGKKMP